MGALRTLRPGVALPADCVLYFTAEWCGPCQQIRPAVAALAEDMPGIHFYVVDVDAHADLAQARGVCTVPTFHVIRGGCAAGECGNDVDALRRLAA